MDIGNADIKTQRRNCRVPITPEGFVADYVPFYFASRSPMLFAIYKNNVPTFSGGQDEIIYLVTSIESILKHRLPFVFTDRNAALAFTNFSNSLNDLNTFIDWDLMEARMWADTPQEPDRMERRMAEFLVHQHVPWAAFIRVVASNKAKRQQAFSALSTIGAKTPIDTKPD